MDRKGVPRKESVATRIKKKARPTREVLSLSDSEVEVVSKGKGKSLRSPSKPRKSPSDLYVSDDIQEIPPPTEEMLSRPRPKRAVAQATVKIETTADGVAEDPSSSSDSDYVPDADEKAATKEAAQDDSQDGFYQADDSSEGEAEPLPSKRKSKVDISSRAVKKRAVVEVVSRSVLKGKRKASPGDATSRKKRLVIALASSGDEGTTTRKPPASVNITEPNREDRPTNVANMIECDRKDGPADDSVPMATVEASIPSSTSLPLPVAPALTPTATPLPPPVAPAPTPTTTPARTAAANFPTQPPPVVPVSSHSERPKPRLVTKADRHPTANQDDHDAFSLRGKKTQETSTTMQEMGPLSTASANLLAVEEGRMGSKNEDDRVRCGSPALVGVYHPPNAHDRAATSESLVPQVEFPPSRQSHDGPPMVHEPQAYVSQFPPDCVPFMGGGWYGPPDPRMQGHGYAGPFMGYPQWGALPEMDNSAHQHGYLTGAQTQAAYNSGPPYEGYKRAGYYYRGQPGRQPSQSLHAARRAPYPDAMIAGPSNTESGGYPNGHPAPNRAAIQDPANHTHAEGDK